MDFGLALFAWSAVKLAVSYIISHPCPSSAQRHTRGILQPALGDEHISTSEHYLGSSLQNYMLRFSKTSVKGKISLEKVEWEEIKLLITADPSLEPITRLPQTMSCCSHSQSIPPSTPRVPDQLEVSLIQSLSSQAKHPYSSLTAHRPHRLSLLSHEGVLLKFLTFPYNTTGWATP